MAKPILSGEAVYIPKDGFTHKMRKDLTVKTYDPGEKDPKIVHVWSTRKEGYIGLPREYGLKHLGLDHDESCPAYYSISDYHLPDLWDYQKPWVDDLYRTSDLMGSVVAKAATGKGKTVMSLYVAMKLGMTTLIIVDQEFLRDQWIATLTDLYKVPRDDIGIIQGKVFDIERKSFVVGMVQTLYRRPRDLYLESHFGTIIYDECHTVGAPEFSKVLFMFNAAVRIAVSATPERGDALDRVIKAHLGGVRVTLDAKHLSSSVRVLESDGVYSWYANISPKLGRFVNEIAADGKRNALISEAIKWLYESGRDVLVVSDRIGHLENLIAYCGYLGIPEEDMGVVSGYYHVWSYAKDPTPKRRPLNWEKGTEYTPVKMQLVRKRTPKVRLNSVKEEKRIVFATYGMFLKGVDVPRLSAGVDCTPRAKAEQVHGRILRKKEGKLKPIWVTIRDVNSFRSQYMFGKRVAEYVKSNAEIFRWQMGKGVKKLDPEKVIANVSLIVERLKRRKIVASVDGSNTILTPITEKRLKNTQGDRTAGRTRRSRAR